MQMTLTVSCKDTGIECDFVARAESEEELMTQLVKHGKEVHGYTDEQLSDPAMIEKIKAIVKEE
jgi:predicted small metal-binding protein